MFTARIIIEKIRVCLCWVEYYMYYKTIYNKTWIISITWEINFDCNAIYILLYTVSIPICRQKSYLVR